MKDVINIVENKQTSEFYPTPEKIVQKMLDGIDWHQIQTVLEPSAGKGNILREIARKINEDRWNRPYLDVDCIEIDPHIRSVLKYEFSDERRKIIDERIRVLENEREYDRKNHKYFDLPEEKHAEYSDLKKEKNTFFKSGLHIIHDDFLTYEPFKTYDLIVMNPPFSNGDKHLLKAIEMQRKGGNIVCLLNAETIRNPYTQTRKHLINLLNQYNAQIEYIEDAFTDAERKTEVEIALIKISIPEEKEESDIYNHFVEAENVSDFEPCDSQEIEISDFIKAAVSRYRVECKAGIELIRQYKAMQPYITRGFAEDEKEPILKLTDTYDRSYTTVSVNDFLKSVRVKYWKALLANPKFTGKLTSKLQNEYRKKVERLSDYDFSEFNIINLTTEMNAQIKKGIEDEIIAMFDRLTVDHSYYPEFSNNRHYYDGWKTNSAYKIGKKVIIPCHGVFNSWNGRPQQYNAREIIEDIERIFNFLDGNMTKDVDLGFTLQRYFDAGETRNIPLKYFKATFYKKGTLHLVFTCPDLVERLNIYAAQHKAWLPPSYGKKKYKDMTLEEKSVVDSFQGEKEYEKVLKKAQYYFAPVNGNQPLMLSV